MGNLKKIEEFEKLCVSINKEDVGPYTFPTDAVVDHILNLIDTAVKILKYYLQHIYLILWIICGPMFYGIMKLFMTPTFLWITIIIKFIKHLSKIRIKP